MGLACLLALAGCSSLSGTGDKGYITGEGVPTEVKAVDRGNAGRADRHRPRRQRRSTSPTCAASPWSSTCGGRSARRAASSSPTSTRRRPSWATASTFLGLNIRDSGVEKAQAFVRNYDVPYPSIYAPDGRALLSFAGTLNPRSIPSTVVLDAAGPRRRVRAGPDPDHADPALPRREGAAMSDWFQDTALSGSLVLALPVALLAGLVSFFSPCVIPLLPGYLSYATGISGGDLEDARRSRLVTGAVLFVLGFAVVFVLLGSLTGAAGAWLFVHTRQLNVVLGDHHDPARHRLPRRLRLPPARLAHPPGARRRPGRGAAASASSSGSAGPRASGPTLAAINVLSVNEATATRGAVLSGGLRPRARAAVHRRRAGLPPDDRAPSPSYAVTRCSSSASAA